MSAYFVFHNKGVRDPQSLLEYKEAVAPIVEGFGGTYRVIGGEPQVLEGAWHPNFLVLIEFPSLERARAWYQSDEYADLKAQRLAAVDSEAILMTGLDESKGALDRQ